MADSCRGAVAELVPNRSGDTGRLSFRNVPKSLELIKAPLADLDGRKNIVLYEQEVHLALFSTTFCI